MPESNKYREALGFQGQRVDTEAGIIHGVKLLGPVSSNGPIINGIKYDREYTPKFLKSMVKKYEGRPAYLNHDPWGMPSVENAVGVYRNPEYQEGKGIFADLHLMKSHPFSSRLIEDAERSMGVFSLSHNPELPVEAKLDHKLKKEFVNGAAGILSVDVVPMGGTTKNLFESANNSQTSEEGKKSMEINDITTYQELKKHAPAALLDDIAKCVFTESKEVAELQAKIKALQETIQDMNIREHKATVTALVKDSGVSVSEGYLEHLQTLSIEQATKVISDFKESVQKAIPTARAIQVPTVTGNQSPEAIAKAYLEQWEGK